MAFWKNTETGMGEMKPGAAKWKAIPQVNWGPGYKDPRELLDMRDRYLIKWANEGKRIDQWRRALALAHARNHYYHHITWKECFERKRIKGMRESPKLRAHLAKMWELHAKRREARKARPQPVRLDLGL